MEYQDAAAQNPEPFNVDAVRLQLYRLMHGNWHTRLLDLGDVAAGNTLEDTYFALTTIVAELLVQNIIPIVIGTSQHLTYATYRAFDKIKNSISLIAIDSRFDFGEGTPLIAPDSYMSKMITGTPTHPLYLR